jgi:hypothetical protein
MALPPMLQATDGKAASVAPWLASARAGYAWLCMARMASSIRARLGVFVGTMLVTKMLVQPLKFVCGDNAEHT